MLGPVNAIHTALHVFSVYLHLNVIISNALLKFVKQKLGMDGLDDMSIA